MSVGGVYMFGGCPLVCLCGRCSVCSCYLCVYLCVVYLWRLSGVGGGCLCMWWVSVKESENVFRIGVTISGF